MYSVSDLEASAWRDLASPPDSWSIASAFTGRVQKLRDEGHARAAEALGLIVEVLRLHLVADHPSEPFQSWFSIGDRRSLIPSDLTEEQLDFLAQVAVVAPSPEVEARLLDVLYVRGHGARAQRFKRARRAVTAYLEASIGQEEAGAFHSVALSLARAETIAAEIGRPSGEPLTEVRAVTSGIVAARAVRSEYRHVLPLIDLLVRRGHEDLHQVASFAELIAGKHAEEGDPYIAGRYYKAAEQAFKRCNDLDGVSRMQVSRAESWARHAASSPSAMNATSAYRNAIKAYREAGAGYEKRRAELRALLLDVQLRIPDEMGRISTPIDVGDMREQVRAEFEGRSLMSSLLLLGLHLTPVSLDEAKGAAAQSAQLTPLLTLIATEKVDAKGRTTHRRSGGFEDEEGALEAGMHQYAQLHRLHGVAGFIRTARHMITAEHAVQVSDLLPLVTMSAFVPRAREYAFARGLHAGLYGDGLAAANVLIPQIEYAIKEVMEQHGLVVSKLDDDGIQDAYGLNRVLKGEDRVVLEQVLGPDMVYDLADLLVARSGENLRNRAMHGLMSDGEFDSAPVEYFWWLALRLCCLYYGGPLPDGFHRGKGQDDEPPVE